MATCAGDVLSFPDCELRVTQPRKPCYKFAAFELVAGPRTTPLMALFPKAARR